jgi:hypothetical protein
LENGDTIDKILILALVLLLLLFASIITITIAVGHTPNCDDDSPWDRGWDGRPYPYGSQTCIVTEGILGILLIVGILVVRKRRKR